MTKRYHPGRNWGCLVAAALGAPALFFIFLGGMLGGGGCEGREEPCTPDYSRMWLGIVTVVAIAAALAWGINRLVVRIQSRKADGEQ
jgi:hypothetical protein